MDFVADTTFLVGLWRGQAWALDFSMNHPRSTLGIPWVVEGEFWHGALRAGHDPEKVGGFLTLGLPLRDPAPSIPHYAQICCELQKEGILREVGQNDLWIAAAALAEDRPLVSRNRRHFDRITGLKLAVAGVEGK